MKFPSIFWSVPLRSTSTVVAVLLALAVPYANAQTISPGLWHATSGSVPIMEGDQSQGTPKADLTSVNTLLATDRRDDGQAPVFTLASGGELFTVRTTGENPVLSLKPNADIDYEKSQSVAVRICATVAGATPGTTVQECYSLTINVRPRDEAPVLNRTFGPDNTLYLTATDALPRYNLLNHFADPERQNITGELLGQTSVSSQDGYTLEATLTADVLLSFTKRLPPWWNLVQCSGACLPVSCSHNRFNWKPICDHRVHDVPATWRKYPPCVQRRCNQCRVDSRRELRRCLLTNGGSSRSRRG